MPLAKREFGLPFGYWAEFSATYADGTLRGVLGEPPTGSSAATASSFSATVAEGMESAALVWQFRLHWAPKEDVLTRDYMRYRARPQEWCGSSQMARYFWGGIRPIEWK
jgi:hypothetical protein